ncbi:MAG: FAD-dependent oxidoreductase [Cyclobacteriaceae bacterium]|nr:FAD-dependent oxidoreductase [Cyclobacteriaceae bacterium]
MKIAIIGAGIGGLTTAIALKQKGLEVEIFEAASEFKKAGSGINLALNAMQVYKRLGLYEKIFEAGSYTHSMNITDEKLKPLSVINLKTFEKKHHVKSVAIHRTTLHQILLNQLSDVSLHLDKKVKIVTQSNNGAEIQFEDGTKHSAEVLIGADGIHSNVRKSIFEHTELRIAKQICWRGITEIEISDKYQTELNELWGKGKRFGFVAIENNRYYWYALTNYKKNYKEEFKEVDLVEFYSDFNPLIGQIIKSTPKENILTHEMADLKPIPAWYNKKVCLLGDSAHATTPNLGQGACQAIESAMVLANCLAKHKTTGNAFAAYQNTRIKKAINVVNTSWRIGKMIHLENSFAIKLRNLILRIIPEKIVAKQNAPIFKIAD